MTFGINIAKDVMIPMRDGVRLATDIYRPASDGDPLAGPFPTILARTSYNKAAQRYVEEIAYFFVPHGYAVALQDLRGRYQSEGTGQYFHASNVNEGRDGYDTVEWIAAQPWSNGRVGTVGSSHVGIVQTQMALERPPHLTSIWPDVVSINYYANMCRMGGAMQLHMFGALFLHAQDSQEVRDDPAARQLIIDAMEHMRDLVYQTPFKPGQTALAAVPNLEKMLFYYYCHGAYDEFWQQECNDMERYFDRHADIPATFSGGWFDPFAIDMTSYYAAMARQNNSHQRLIMGPWNHMGMRGAGHSHFGDVDFGLEAAWGNPRYNAEQLRWFDRWLKDEATGVENDPPVQIFVMGGGDGRRTAQGKLNHGGTWRGEHEWPLTRTQFTTYYLQPGGGLAPDLPASDNLSAHFTFDPSHPVPTIGGAVTGFFEMVSMGELDAYWVNYLPPWVRMRSIVLEGPAHQKEEPGIVGAQHPYPTLAARPDVLVFQTESLAEDIEVTGPIVVKLWISTSAPDTDFTAKLVDVHPPNPDYPGGYHMNLTDSIIRTRYRNSWEQEELMESGEVYPVTIELPPTSNLFKAGHRLRLDISSSNFPRFDINPNTGEPMGQHTHTQLAHNAVYFDRERPSHIVLPLIPTTN